MIISEAKGKEIISKLKVLIEQKEKSYEFSESELLSLTLIWLEELVYLKSQLLEDIEKLFKSRLDLQRKIGPDYNSLEELFR